MILLLSKTINSKDFVIMFSVSHSPKAVINFVLELEHCYSDAFISKARFKVY